MNIEQWPIDRLIPYARNPRINDGSVETVAASIKEFGFQQPIVVDGDGVIIVGHTRYKAAKRLGLETVPVVVAANLTPAQVKAYRIMDNRSSHASEWDMDLLALEMEDLRLADFDLDLTGFDAGEIAGMLDDATGDDDDDDEAGADTEPQIDKREELRQQWGVETGQLWLLGEHRLLCGDSTKAEDVARVMMGERASLLHADPPYGMGKESEGVQNDNLYREKLDAFQMAWWRAFRPALEDNASAYIWGNAPDLWRLWYVGGLAASERLTMRNEIAWDKREDNPAILVSNLPYARVASRRMYYPTERCLFFMLGEQGFNNNADNYWDGWEPIRAYLESEMKRCGWTVADINRITGTFMGGHWVTKSQWQLITAEHYAKIQAAARDHKAFKREYDELKREYDATRAYFDNTHDIMTDIWAFPRVTGAERHGHATPKPVAMIERAIKSSAPVGGIVAEPFSGSGTTIIACENLFRKCRAIEISPAYVAVALQRWADHTGQTPTLADA